MREPAYYLSQGCLGGPGRPRQDDVLAAAQRRDDRTVHRRVQLKVVGAGCRELLQRFGVELGRRHDDNLLTFRAESGARRTIRPRFAPWRLAWRRPVAVQSPRMPAEGT